MAGDGHAGRSGGVPPQTSEGMGQHRAVQAHVTGVDRKVKQVSTIAAQAREDLQMRHDAPFRVVHDEGKRFDVTPRRLNWAWNTHVGNLAEDLRSAAVDPADRRGCRDPLQVENGHAVHATDRAPTDRGLDGTCLLDMLVVRLEARHSGVTAKASVAAESQQRVLTDVGMQGHGYGASLSVMGDEAVQKVAAEAEAAHVGPHDHALDVPATSGAISGHGPRQPDNFALLQGNPDVASLPVGSRQPLEHLLHGVPGHGPRRNRLALNACCKRFVLGHPQEQIPDAGQVENTGSTHHGPARGTGRNAQSDLRTTPRLVGRFLTVSPRRRIMTRDGPSALTAS